MIGFDIGGTKCAVCVGAVNGENIEITDKRVIPTRHTISPYEMLEKMCSEAEKMTDNFSVIGISCGGPLDSQKGIIMSPPNLPGWDNIKITEYLKKRYNSNVYLENDANACAVAEWKLGAGRDCDNMIFLTFGTGLGAGMILNGHLYRGASDMAGEVGHIRLSSFGPVGYGKVGSFEGFCSGNGIAQIGKSYALEKFQMGKSVSFCKDMVNIEQITAKSIAGCANSGCDDAIEIFNISGKLLGKGLSILIDILNPEKIILGSIYQRCEHLLRPTMEKTLMDECLAYSLRKCEILPTELKESIGDFAALAVAVMNEEERGKHG